MSPRMSDVLGVSAVDDHEEMAATKKVIRRVTEIPFSFIQL